jgi:hypothetical protein
MDEKLDPILALVGKLDDTVGDETPRERFRSFLEKNVLEISKVRDYVEECLGNSGDQYCRALQDLVNHIGRLLQFKVEFGRYHGLPSEIGFDGLWSSTKEKFHLVVEVKTTEVYPIKTSTLMDYINRLISEKKIPGHDQVMGLYVIGRPDKEIHNLKNEIIADNKTDKLRIISVESLLTLAEMMNEYNVTHEDILAILKPPEPNIDPLIDLLKRLIYEGKEEVQGEEETMVSEPQAEGDGTHWITPVQSDETGTAEEIVKQLVGQAHIYAFGDKAHGRKHLKADDWICFYATGKGIIAHAQISSAPSKKPDPRVHHHEKYPWTLNLKDTHLYADKPIVIDAAIRAQLDAFKGRDPAKPWAWLIQATRKITKHDFEILTQTQNEK